MVSLVVVVHYHDDDAGSLQYREHYELKWSVPIGVGMMSHLCGGVGDDEAEDAP